MTVPGEAPMQLQTATTTTPATPATFSDHVNTKIACLACRDKKLKCDKKLPRCTRCRDKNITCVYMSHKKTGPKPSKNPRKKRQRSRSGSESDQASNTRASTGELQLEPMLQTFRADSLTQFLTNQESPEDSLGLSDIGLTMDDVTKMHEFYFGSNLSILKFSEPRYYNRFHHDPLGILHYSYMIWTMAAFNMPQYESKVEALYTKGSQLIDMYFDSSAESSRIDSLSCLHALCLRAIYEFMAGKEVKAAMTICTSVRLAQLMGYDQIDISPNTLATPTVFLKTLPGSVPSGPASGRVAGQFDSDDMLDPEIPLREEKRRAFWEVYAIDKWYSLVTGLPCAFAADGHSVIWTKLPSPTTCLPFNGEVDAEAEMVAAAGKSSKQTSDDSEATGFYLHEAMEKLDKNQVLIDMNSSSSKVLLLTVSENIIKWCTMFLTIVELDKLRTDKSLQEIRVKIDELVHNFENLQSNILYFDMRTEPDMSIVINNTAILLYQSVLLKLSNLFDTQLKESSTGTTISHTERTIFSNFLVEVADLSCKLVRSLLSKSHIDRRLKVAPIFIVFTNSLKSLLQCSAYAARFSFLLGNISGRNDTIWDLMQTTSDVFSRLNQNQNTVKKVCSLIDRGSAMVHSTPRNFSFFDSFFDVW